MSGGLYLLGMCGVQLCATMPQSDMDYRHVRYYAGAKGPNSSFCLSSSATYSFIQSSALLPLCLSQASHFALARNWMAQGWSPFTSPSLTCLNKPYKINFLSS